MSFAFPVNISSTSNSFGKRDCQQAGSKGSSCILRYMERGHTPICPKETKEELKFCHGWGYAVVLP